VTFIVVLYCFNVLNFTEIGQSAAELWPTFFKQWPSTILNFHIWSCHSYDCHRVPNLHIVAVAPDCTLPASASSESSRSLGGDGRPAWSPFLRFLIGDHGVWGPCRGILYFMPLSESKSTRTVVSNAVGVCAMSHGTINSFIHSFIHANDETVGIIN